MGLLWTWSVLNGLLWMVCYERVCFEWEPNLPPAPAPAKFLKQLRLHWKWHSGAPVPQPWFEFQSKRPFPFENNFNEWQIVQELGIIWMSLAIHRELTGIILCDVCYATIEFSWELLIHCYTGLQKVWKSRRSFLGNQTCSREINQLQVQ